MLQRLGTVPHTEPVHVENGSSKIPYQVGTTETYPTRNQHSRYWLHSSLNLYCACQHMSTWTQLSQGSSVTQPANDPASITVLDCPHISWNIFQGQDSTEVYLSILERSVGWKSCCVHMHKCKHTMIACKICCRGCLQCQSRKKSLLKIDSFTSTVSNRSNIAGEADVRPSHWWLASHGGLIVVSFLHCDWPPWCWSFQVWESWQKGRDSMQIA